MLEIVVLFFLCKSLGNKLREKGRTPIGYQLLLIVAWFGAEAVTGFVWGVVAAIQNGGQPVNLGIGVYVAAIAAAGFTAGLIFFIVHLLPSLHPVQQTQFGHNVPFGQNVPPSPSNSNNPFEPPRQ